MAGSNSARGMAVCLLCLYVVLFCVGRGLFDGPITRPEESYRMSVCVIKKPQCRGGQGSNVGSSVIGKKKNITNFGPTVETGMKFC
jgi:hypothetical protein